MGRSRISLNGRDGSDLSEINAEFENDLKKRYREFVLSELLLAISELLLAIMEEDHLSIRKLAKEAGVSPSSIQDPIRLSLKWLLSAEFRVRRSLLRLESID